MGRRETWAISRARRVTLRCTLRKPEGAVTRKHRSRSISRHTPWAMSSPRRSLGYRVGASTTVGSTRAVRNVPIEDFPESIESRERKKRRRPSISVAVLTHEFNRRHHPGLASAAAYVLEPIGDLMAGQPAEPFERERCAEGGPPPAYRCPGTAVRTRKRDAAAVSSLPSPTASCGQSSRKRVRGPDGRSGSGLAHNGSSGDGETGSLSAGGGTRFEASRAVKNRSQGSPASLAGVCTKAPSRVVGDVLAATYGAASGSAERAVGGRNLAGANRGRGSDRATSPSTGYRGQGFAAALRSRRA